MHTGTTNSHQSKVATQALTFIVSALLSTLCASIGFIFAGTVDTGAPIAVHFSFNSVVPFASDPWLTLLATFTTIPELTWYYLLLVISLFFTSARPIVSIAAVSGLLVLFGYDRVLLGMMAWLPLCLWCLKRFERRGELPLLIALVFLGVRSTYGAGALVAVPLIICLIRAIAAGSISVTPTITGEKSRGLLACLALGIGALLTLHHLQELPNVDYPPTAIVVPDDGLAGTLQPLIGDHFDLAVIDLPRVTAFLILPWIIALGMTITTAPRFTLGWISLICLGLDLFTSGQLHAISPIASLSRIIPGTFLYPLSAIILCGLLWWLTIKQNSPIRAVAFGLLMAVAGFMHHSFGSVAASQTLSSNFSPAIMASPSLAVIARSNNQIMAWQNIYDDRTKIATSSSDQLSQTLAWHLCEANVSSNIGTISNFAALSDNNSSTRVSLGQAAGSTLKICFSHSLPAAIWLDTGDYKTDFPRNFSLFMENSPSHISYSPWLGPIEFTNKQHLPFYGTQSDVMLTMPNLSQAPNESRCITLQLDQSNAPFDWSIAELRCL